MREWKYVVAGLSCAALLAFAPTPQVNAETTPDVVPVGSYNANVDASFANQTLTIQVGRNSGKLTNTKLYVSFPTVKDGKVTKDGTWVSYDVPDKSGLSGDGKVVIDLSSRKIAADFYVQVKGNGNTDPEIFHFAPTEVKYKGVVNNATAKVELQYAQGDKKGKATEATLEYRTANGAWKDYSSASTDLSIYQENGATVNFRTKAVDNPRTYDENSQTYKNAAEFTESAKPITTKDGATIKTYDVNGSFASNEVKVKIGKRPSGPKISVDYKKHTFTIAKGLYRVYSGIEKVAGIETALTTKTVIKGDTTYELTKDGKKYDVPYIASDGAIEAWNAAETGTKTKARSSYTSLIFNGKPVLAFKDLDGKNDGIDTSAYVNENEIVDEKGATLVEAKFNEQTTKQLKDKKHTLVITNKSSSQAYEVIVSDSEEAPEADVSKTTSIAKGKSKSFTVSDKQMVWIRSSADAKAGVWSSDFEFFGQVPETIDATAESVTYTDNSITITFGGTVTDSLAEALKVVSNYTVSDGLTIEKAEVSGKNVTITFSALKAGNVKLGENITKLLLSGSKNTINIGIKTNTETGESTIYEAIFS